MVKYSPIARTRFEFAYAEAWRRSLEAERAVRRRSRVQRAAVRDGEDAPLLRWPVDSRGCFGTRTSTAPGWPRRRPVACRTGRTAHRACIRARRERHRLATPRRLSPSASGSCTSTAGGACAMDHVRVIPNWAPLDELTPGERDNAWSRRQQLPQEPIRLMYAGTLGRKHNPLLLLELLDGVSRQRSGCLAHRRLRGSRCRRPRAGRCGARRRANPRLPAGRGPERHAGQRRRDGGAARTGRRTVLGAQ